MQEGVFVENTIIFLQELLQLTAGIPLAAIPLEEKALTAFLQNATGYASNAKLRDSNPFWRQLLAVRNNELCECNLSDDTVFLMSPLRTKNTIILLGPILTPPTENPSQLQRIHRIGELVIGYLSAKEEPAEALLLHHPTFSGEDISQMRRVEQRYEYSAALTDAVQQGNLSLAMHLISRYDPGSQTEVRNTNPLRNAQNYCIVLNTQLRHALENSGIHPYQVDRLSNEIGLEIERLKSISQLPDFFSSVIRRYCQLVQEHAYPNLRPLTNLAVTYIKEHLADNLTVKDSAKALTVNANYLSSLFRKDMGMTFIDFVNKERTNQAAALLRHTNLQIQQIASTVGYNNTSYFAKQFVRFQGISPSHYRRQI